jgi:hypothetical protein
VKNGCSAVGRQAHRKWPAQAGKAVRQAKQAGRAVRQAKQAGKAVRQAKQAGRAAGMMHTTAHRPQQNPSQSSTCSTAAHQRQRYSSGTPARRCRRGTAEVQLSRAEQSISTQSSPHGAGHHGNAAEASRLPGLLSQRILQEGGGGRQAHGPSTSKAARAARQQGQLASRQGAARAGGTVHVQLQLREATRELLQAVVGMPPAHTAAQASQHIHMHDALTLPGRWRGGCEPAPAPDPSAKPCSSTGTQSGMANLG